MREGSRIVMLASRGHHVSDVDLDDPNFERTPYNPWAVYGRAKTANILFAMEFDRRHRNAGIRASAVHPGTILTELGRHTTQEMREASATSGRTIRDKTIPQGAATSLWTGVVADADVVGGRYCKDCRVAEVTEDQGVENGVRSYALDSRRASVLWETSEKLVGERFA